MINEEQTEIIVNLIVKAGMCKTHSMLAIKYARNSDFKLAKEEMQKADEEFSNAHKEHTKFLTNECKMQVNLLMVHAQDHLMMALMAKENALELIKMYERIKKLEDKL